MAVLGAVHKFRDAEVWVDGPSRFVTPGGVPFFKTSRDKVNRMELLICYIFCQLSISSTENN